MAKIIIRAGEPFHRKVMPHSEVCIHMAIAGKIMFFELTAGPHHMVQLYKEDGSYFSSPITTGEAGLFQEESGAFYYYENDVGENLF